MSAIEKPYAFIEPNIMYENKVKRLAECAKKMLELPVVESDGYDENREQIVELNLASMKHQDFLKKLVKEKKTKGIKCIFIQSGKEMPSQELEDLFRVVEIDLRNPELSKEEEQIFRPYAEVEIMRKSMDNEIRACRLLEKAKMKKVKREVMKRIKELKPRDVLAEQKKFLLKLKLQKYGTPEELLEILKTN